MVTFSAQPADVAAGDVSTLIWSVRDATEVKIEPSINYDDDGPTVPMSGQKGVTPRQSTTYVLTATGPGGSANASASITVRQRIPTVTLTLNPPNIIAGNSSTLTWNSTDAEKITIEPGLGAVNPPSGTLTVSPAQTTTYTATATGPGGAVTGTATLTVESRSVLALTFSATPPSIPSGGSVTLRWETQNASSVSIEPGIGNVDLNGSVVVKPAQSTTYTASAHDAAGNVQTATAQVTVGTESGLNKIKHIVFFVQENRSFDNYFGMLGRYREKKGLPNDIDGLDLNHGIPDVAGHIVKPFKQRSVVIEWLTPLWNESHSYVSRQGDGSFKMDRFLFSAGRMSKGPDRHGTRAIGYHDETDIPYYYELASQFATSDRFFSSTMSGTIANRTYLMAATSAGLVLTNDPFPKNLKTIFGLLSEKGIRWRYYYQDNSVFYYFFDEAQKYGGNVRHLDEYFNILARPTADQDLPEVVFIEHAALLRLDEHVGNDIQKGVADAKRIIDALLKSTAWPSSVFILTHDEGGGLYDHVPPYQVSNPDGIAPMLKDTDSGKWDNFTYSGFRVPLIVISPWVKPHFVSHVNREFTSILKLIQSRFGLPSLTLRDAEADDMTEFFDFSNPAWLTPPPLPDQPVECPGDTITPRCSIANEAESGHPQ